MQKLGQDTQASAEQAFVAAGGMSNLAAAQQAAFAQANQGYSAFQQLGRSIGLSDTQIQALAQHYGLIPSQVVSTITTNAPQVTQEVENLAAQLQAVPIGKSITVATPGSPETIAQLRQIGVQVVETPDHKQIIMTVQSQQAMQGLQEWINKANGAKGEPQLGINPQQFNTGLTTAQNQAKQPVTAPLLTNPSAFTSSVGGAKTNAAMPVTSPFMANVIGFTGPVQTAKTTAAAPVTTPHQGDSAPFTGTVSGAKQSAASPVTSKLMADPAGFNATLAQVVAAAGGTTATAHLNAEPAGATGVLQAWVAAVTGTTGMAKLNADPAQANQVLQTWVTAVNGTTGTAKIAANAAQAQATLAQLIAQINSSVGTVTIRANKVGFAGGGIAPVGFADGGIAPTVHRFAGGGWEDTARESGLAPMPAGVPAIVPPNTWRVVGDRARDDEFFIPDDGAPTSVGLISEAARRQNMALVPLGAHGTPSMPPVVKMADGGLLSMVDAMVGELGQVTLSALADARSSTGTGSTITSEQAQQIIDAIHELRDTIASARPVDARTTINNPVAEKGADSTAARMRTLSALGVFS